MSKTKQPEKQPDRAYVVNGQRVTREDYQRYKDEMNALREQEYQLARICLSQNGNKRRW